MIHLQFLIESHIRNDYGCNIQTGLVLIPGISLIVQKVRAATKIRLVEAGGPYEKNFQETSYYKKLLMDYKWHFIGSAIQAIAFSTLMWRYSPWFAFPFLIAAYQAGRCALILIGGFDFIDNQNRLKLRVGYFGI